MVGHSTALEGRADFCLGRVLANTQHLSSVRHFVSVGEVPDTLRPCPRRACSPCDFRWSEYALPACQAEHAETAYQLARALERWAEHRPSEGGAPLTFSGRSEVRLLDGSNGAFDEAEPGRVLRPAASSSAREAWRELAAD